MAQLQIGAVLLVDVTDVPPGNIDEGDQERRVSFLSGRGFLFCSFAGFFFLLNLLSDGGEIEVPVRVADDLNYWLVQNCSFNLHALPQQRPKFDNNLEILRAHEIARGIGGVFSHGEIGEPRAETAEQRRLHFADRYFSPQGLLVLLYQITFIARDQRVDIE